MANLYWNGSNSQNWDDVLNWWTDASATIQADNAPWTASDTTYLDYNLTLATSPVADPIINNFGNNYGGSGICDIDNIQNLGGNIISGTFTGDDFLNITPAESNISGGTFTGSGLQNAGVINGGVFSGSGLENFGYIYSGTFTGTSFVNNNGLILGGTFSSGAITITEDSGNTLLAITGGPTLAYPTPASGGGSSGVNIARLLNLPWFIKI